MILQALQGGGGGEGRLQRIFLKGQNFFVSPLLSKRKNDNPHRLSLNDESKLWAI